jgi:iron-sulfur cluster assembly protein
MFTVTPAAALQILRAAEQQNEGQHQPKLRVAAKFGSQGDILYGMGFDDEREEDVVLDCEGVAVLIAPPSLALLVGATLDFIEVNAGEYQFIFVNPNERSDCGSTSCGGGHC